MSQLDAMRDAIDRIDAQIVRLFEQRMAVTEQVGRYKQENHIPVLDSRREQAVLESKVALLQDKSLAADVTTLYETIMAISRRQQRRIARAGNIQSDPEVKE